jgi:hypothetical protein
LSGHLHVAEYLRRRGLAVGEHKDARAPSLLEQLILRQMDAEEDAPGGEGGADAEEAKRRGPPAAGQPSPTGAAYLETVALQLIRHLHIWTAELHLDVPAVHAALRRLQQWGARAAEPTDPSSTAGGAAGVEGAAALDSGEGAAKRPRVSAGVRHEAGSAAGAGSDVSSAVAAGPSVQDRAADSAAVSHAAATTAASPDSGSLPSAVAAARSGAGAPASAGGAQAATAAEAAAASAAAPQAAIPAEAAPAEELPLVPAPPAVTVAYMCLVAGEDANGMRGHDGSTPLHQAAEAGLPSLVAALLLLGADVHAVDVDGQTPLGCARRGRAEAGCDVGAAGGGEPGACASVDGVASGAAHGAAAASHRTRRGAAPRTGEDYASVGGAAAAAAAAAAARRRYTLVEELLRAQGGALDWRAAVRRGTAAFERAQGPAPVLSTASGMATFAGGFGLRGGPSLAPGAGAGTGTGTGSAASVGRLSYALDVVADELDAAAGAGGGSSGGSGSSSVSSGNGTSSRRRDPSVQMSTAAGGGLGSRVAIRIMPGTGTRPPMRAEAGVGTATTADGASARVTDAGPSGDADGASEARVVVSAMANGASADAAVDTALAGSDAGAASAAAAGAGGSEPAASALSAPELRVPRSCELKLALSAVIVTGPGADGDGGVEGS